MTTETLTATIPMHLEAQGHPLAMKDAREMAEEEMARILSERGYVATSELTGPTFRMPDDLEHWLRVDFTCTARPAS